MKILVIGGHGFVGTNLTQRLVKKGHDVRPLSRRDGVDLMEMRSVRTALESHQPEAIFNCAAHVGSMHYVMQNSASVAHDNLQMALNLYRSVAKVAPRAHVINPLSNCSYPGDAEVHNEPDWWAGEVHHSVFAYANAKRFIYVLARCYATEHGVRTSNFLVPNTFGVGDHLDTNRTHAISGMITRMIRAREEGAPRFEVWGSGRPVREWGYIDDITEIMSCALDMDVGLIYPVNIGQNHGATIRETAEAIRDAVGYEGELWFNTKYEDGASRKVLDDRRFRQLFPTFKFTDHLEAIRRTVAYYESKLSTAHAPKSTTG